MKGMLAAQGSDAVRLLKGVQTDGAFLSVEVFPARLRQTLYARLGSRRPCDAFVELQQHLIIIWRDLAVKQFRHLRGHQAARQARFVEGRGAHARGV